MMKLSLPSTAAAALAVSTAFTSATAEPVTMRYNLNDLKGEGLTEHLPDILSKNNVASFDPANALFVKVEGTLDPLLCEDKNRDGMIDYQESQNDFNANFSQADIGALSGETYVEINNMPLQPQQTGVNASGSDYVMGIMQADSLDVSWVRVENRLGEIEAFLINHENEIWSLSTVPDDLVAGENNVEPRELCFQASYNLLDQIKPAGRGVDLGASLKALDEAISEEQEPEVSQDGLNGFMQWFFGGPKQ